MTAYERRKSLRRSLWEIVDVEMAHVFHTDDKKMVADYVQAIETLGHRSIVHEVKP